MESMFKKIVKSYALDAALARGQGNGGNNMPVEEFLADLGQVAITRIAAPGRGEHLLLQGKMMQAMALMVDGCCLHVYAFPNHCLDRYFLMRIFSQGGYCLCSAVDYPQN